MFKVLGMLDSLAGVQHLVLEPATSATTLVAFLEDNQYEEIRKSPTGKRWNASWTTSRLERLMNMGVGTRLEIGKICGTVDAFQGFEGKFGLVVGQGKSARVDSTKWLVGWGRCVGNTRSN